MGINLVRQPFFGDPHAEAWELISLKLWGIRARANSTFRSINPLMADLDWFQVRTPFDSSSLMGL